MRYEARIAAYDVMDQIHVGATVWVSEDLVSTSPTPILSVLSDQQGEGISDPTEWLRDALIGLLEAL